MTYRWIMGPMALIAVSQVLAAASGNAAEGPDRPLASPPEPEASREQLRQGVTGRVIAAAGEPVAGALIAAQSLDTPAPPVPDIAILSDERGVYAWPLRPGRYRLTAVVDGRERATAIAVVEPNRRTLLDLQLSR